LISGGGDTFLIVWDYKKGVLHKKVPLSNMLVPDDEICVTSMSVSTNILALTFEKMKRILIFDLTETGDVVFNSFVDVDFEPLKAFFDGNGTLWILNNSKTKVTTLFADSELTTELNQLEPVDTNIDIYEMGKLRKWSQWKPKQERIRFEPGPKKPNKRKRKSAIQDA
jgi:hypothetical protein